MLKVKNLQYYLKYNSNYIRAVDGLTFDIEKGEVVALIGESGCGKSMTALAMMRLGPNNGFYGIDSEIILDEVNLLELSELQMQKVRAKNIGMIFQEPQQSLNPVLTIGEQLIEALADKAYPTKLAKTKRAKELLSQTKIPDIDRVFNGYPHELSGGMKQRVMIAIAMAKEPELLIADEPTTALDVTIAKEILTLLKSQVTQSHMSMLFITHDLAVAKQIADKIMVMYAGHLVEISDVEAFFERQAHPYSKQLLDSIPNYDSREYSLPIIDGIVPSLTKSFSKCRFLDRCNYKIELCEQKLPKFKLYSDTHAARCLLDKNIDLKTRFSDNKFTKTSENNDMILTAEDLSVEFSVKSGLFRRTVGQVKAVNNVSFDIKSGKTLAVVGESGCGKTTLARALLKLIPKSRGKVFYNSNHDIVENYQMIVQDPFSAMNPKFTIRDVILEGVNQSKLFRKVDKDKLVDDLLLKVGLEPEFKLRYPHEFSGGQRQRIVIARALALNPKLIICDEPTSALDVSVQAQVLNLLKQLQLEQNLSYIFITHDMAVVEYMADFIAVMYKGEIVEYGNVEDVIFSPQHEYTQHLLDAVPKLQRQVL